METAQTWTNSEVTVSSLDLSEPALPDDRPQLIQHLRNQTTELQRLRNELAELNQRRRTDTLIAELGEALRVQGDESEAQFGRRCLLWLIERIGGLSGTLYVRRSGTETLHLSGTIGVGEPPPTQLEPGETLIGQAMKSQRRFLLSGSGIVATSSSAILSLKPSTIVIQPFIDRDEVEGVLEMSFIRPPSNDTLEVLEAVTARLALVLHEQRTKQHLRLLLDRTRHDAMRLAQQEEELRQHVNMLETTHDEMRRAQTALRQSNERNRQLFRNIPSIVFQYLLDVSNRRWHFVYASPQTLVMLGLEAEQWCLEMNRHYRQMVHPSDLRRFLTEVRRSFGERSPGRVDIRLRTRQQDWLWVRIEANTQTNDDDTLLAYGIIHNVQHEYEELIKLREESTRLRESEAILLDRIRGTRGQPTRRLL
jgi:PAS domain-containing protein